MSTGVPSTATKSNRPASAWNPFLQHEYWLEYQPIYRPGEVHPRKAEALLRRRSADEPLILPNGFIAALEHSGDIHRLGEWILEQACLQACEWREVSASEVRIAVNISPVQLERANFVAMVERVLLRTGCRAAWIELEISEDMLIRNLHAVQSPLRELAALGCSLSIDDFGTGHSSLARLAELPVDHLKIHGSLLRAATGYQRRARILDAAVAMAQSLGLEVTVEGVERHDHVVLLSRYRGIGMQGYFLARPMKGPQLCAFQTEEPMFSDVIAA